MRRALAVTAVASAFAACSSYGSDGEDVPPDGVDAATEAALDAGVETAAQDGGDLDGGCHASFCDDFENGPIGMTWDSVDNTGGGKLEAVSNSEKGGRAMKATIDAVDAGAMDRYATLIKRLPIGKRVVCSFRFKPDLITFGATDFADYAFIKGGAPAIGIVDYSMIMSLGASATAGMREDLLFDDGGCACPRKSATLPPFTNGAWVAMRLDTDFQTVTVSKDDVVVYKGDFAGFTTNSITLNLGLRAYGPVHIEATYDDLVCDVTN